MERGLLNKMRKMNINENNIISIWDASGGDKDGAAGEEITE